MVKDASFVYTSKKVEAVYKRMVKRMLEKELASGSEESEESWLLYVLECQDGTYYTGITKDLERRIVQHNRGTASRYTRTRRPVKVIYSESCGSHPSALVRECAVKALSREEKEKLVIKKGRIV